MTNTFYTITAIINRHADFAEGDFDGDAIAWGKSIERAQIETLEDASAIAQELAESEGKSEYVGQMTISVDKNTVVFDEDGEVYEVLTETVSTTPVEKINA